MKRNRHAVLIRTFPAIVLLMSFTMLVNAQVTPVHTVEGNSHPITGSHFGTSVDGVGDYDGDGKGDFLVGARSYFHNGGPNGAAHIVSGSTGAILQTVFGPIPGNAPHFGHAVASLGDVDLDGTVDVIVGAPETHTINGNEGQAVVFSGATGSILFTFEGQNINSQCGTSVACGGFIDSDSIPDVIVGSPGDGTNGHRTGSVSVLSGASGQVIWVRHGTTILDHAGSAVAGVGDVNFDGWSDVAIGIPFHDGIANDCGQVLVCSGLDGSVIYSIDGNATGEMLGSVVSAIGDVNSDGFMDIAVTSPGLLYGTSNPGTVGVYSGASGVLLFTLIGPRQGMGFGSSISSAGDIDLDGHDDIVIGSPLDDVNGIDSGSVSLFSGGDGFPLYTLFGASAGEQFGSSVSSSGEALQSLSDGLIVGADEAQVAGPDAGRAYVFSADDMAPAQRHGGGQPNSAASRMIINHRHTGLSDGPFIANIQKATHMTIDLYGAPNAFYDIYASSVLNPGGWLFPGFGSFDLGTGPSFSDVFVLLSGLRGLGFYSLDGGGRASLVNYVNPATPSGPWTSIQALIQREQPWSGGTWGSLSAAHCLIVQ